MIFREAMMGIKSLAAKLVLARASSRAISPPISLPLKLKGKSLLVLLPPSQKDLTVVKQILPDITGHFGDENVYLLAPANTDVATIFPSKGFHIISLSKADVNWCELPSKSFLERLAKKKFNYIFDTNLEYNSFAARILLNFPAAIRFAAIGGLGLPYINLEIKTKFLRDRRMIYRSILEVIAVLAVSEPLQETVG